MSQEKFSFAEAISFGWEKMKINFWLFVAILLSLGVIGSISESLNKRQGDDPELFLVSIAIWIFYMIAEMGLIYISLKIHDGKKAEYSDLFACYKKVFDYFLATLLFMLIFIAGIALLIVPGIIWAIKFQFYGYFIIDKGLKPMEALKASARITKGSKWHLFKFGLLLFLITLAGLLALVVGLFAAVPTTLVAMAFVYRKLSIDEQSAKIEEAQKKNEETAPKTEEDISQQTEDRDK